VVVFVVVGVVVVVFVVVGVVVVVFVVVGVVVVVFVVVRVVPGGNVEPHGAWNEEMAIVLIKRLSALYSSIYSVQRIANFCISLLLSFMKTNKSFLCSGFDDCFD
jgi:hypothetical protein